MNAAAAQHVSNRPRFPLAKWTRVSFSALTTIFATLTVFGSVFVLYMDELKMNRAQIGTLLSLIPLCGVIAPFIARRVAEFGVKRIACTFYTFRKFCAAALVFMPYVLHQFGPEATFIFAACCITLFSISRAIAESAIYPWDHETIPNSMRGKLNAMINIVATLSGLAAVSFASFIIRNGAGYQRFQILILIGSFIGLCGCMLLMRIPGGAPIPRTQTSTGVWREMLTAARDKTFCLFLLGLGLVSLGVTLFFPFVALYLKDTVGIRPANVVLLEIGTLAGGFVTAYFWGWAADRYGGKPSMLIGGYWMVLALFLWHLIPRGSNISTLAATIIGFFGGAFTIAWSTGYLRLMFVAVVPPERRNNYLALFYATLGLSTGAGPFIAGTLLERFKDLQGTFFGIDFNPFTPLMIGSGALILLGLVPLGFVRSDGRTPATKFVGMFLQGNPILALDSLIRYNFVRTESARVQVVERLGNARSPLNIDELIEALGDISFNVRYEVIVAISRTRPDPRLTDALINVVRGREPELAIAAVWALSRIGDRRAIDALREASQSVYPLLAAQAARALGTLGDFASIPMLLEKFRKAEDAGLKLPYASSLGALEAHEATTELLDFLASLTDPSSRNETALAIARSVGPEMYFVTLNRDVRMDGTAAVASALTHLAKRMRLRPGSPTRLVTQAARAFTDDDHVAGVEYLLQALRALPDAWQPPAVVKVLQACDRQLIAHGIERPEYIQLVLHAMDAVVSTVALGQRSRRRGIPD